MMHRGSKREWLTAAITLIVAGGFGFAAHGAAWSSIRANNQTAQFNRAAQPAQQMRVPEPNRATQPAPRNRITAPSQLNRSAQPAPRVAPQVNRPAVAPSPSGEITRNREREAEVGRERGHAAESGGERVREVDAARRAEIDRETFERRHFDFDGDRHRAYHWYGYRPGMIITTLPPAYVPIYVSGVPYYYDQGVYYKSGPSGYVVVNPPLGAVVPEPPPGAEPIVVGSVVYYYANGAFYLAEPDGYHVVTPPPGVTVSELPPDVTAVIINGMQYYQADGAYFMPFIQNGVTVYTTVQP